MSVSNLWLNFFPEFEEKHKLQDSRGSENPKLEKDKS